MNLDVSPDGKTIVFDLLGDIYSPYLLAAAKLRCYLAGGKSYEVQPRFSPDGKQISIPATKKGAITFG
jgi:Tol biopolymer transport system component